MRALSELIIAYQAVILVRGPLLSKSGITEAQCYAIHISTHICIYVLLRNVFLFTRFMENLQTEVLEIEFNEFSKGLPTISELDFAKILLRYTHLQADQ